MKNEEILQHAQEHGDWAFLQGFKAAKQGIKLEDRTALAQMPEALKRGSEFQKIYKGLMESNHGD